MVAKRGDYRMRLSRLPYIRILRECRLPAHRRGRRHAPAVRPVHGLRSIVSNPRSRVAERTLVVVAPGLLTLPDAVLARPAALVRLAALSPDPSVDPAGIDAATSTAVGWRDAPAPLTALGAGIDPAGAWVMHADLLHVDVGASDVLVRGRVDDLDADEARALAADIGELIGREGLRLEPRRPDRWFALSTDDVASETVCVDAMIGRGLLNELSRGEGARPLARMRGEIEMLLHDHPINRARSERGADSADELWLWGGGRLAFGTNAIGPLAVDACPGRAGDLARGLATVACDRHDGRHTAVTVANPLRNDTDLAAFCRDVLGAALSALDEHRIEELVVIADGAGHAATWRARPPSLLRRVGMRLRETRFMRP